jgi:hypothetical protein
MKNLGLVLVCALLQGIIGCSGRTSERPVSAVGLTPTEWASLSRPGPSHKVLAPFVGEWNVRMTFWSSPSSKPEISTGTSSISWILGERFVQEKFSGSAGGDAFEGMGIMGYDNASRVFKTMWVDSLNTAMAMASGKFFAERNAFELTSQLYDPLLSREKTVRSTIHFTSNDSYIFSMIDESPEGKEFKSLEMEYTRKG